MSTTIALPVRASHIVGGEVTYKYLGGYRYQITISIYEDCLFGIKAAIAADNPAYINIFDGRDSSIFVNGDSIYLDGGIRELVPPNFTNSCINSAPATCLEKASFTRTYYLPPNTTGYTVVYQRCCRNASVVNIQEPDITGATYYCVIPPAITNTSAVFKNYPPQIICINNPLVYDHSATDADGDSLSYEFCQDYKGASASFDKPIPTPPPFDPVIYVPPYSYKNPMGGYPMVQVDPKTGIISGTPNKLGRYSVTVCCHEWRKGIMINTISREFQFVVTNCSKEVVANIPQFSTEFNTYDVNCSDFTEHFVNLSKGGFAYFWDFGDTTITTDTSSAFEPTYVYRDTGIYKVKLIVNKGTTCSDSITRLVKIYPKFKANFSYAGVQCPGAQFTFTDLTVSTYRPIILWHWDFGDGITVDSENTTHTYIAGGTYNVTLVSQNYKGCIDTAIQEILIEKFKPFAGDDTIIVKGESIQFDPQGGIQYTWSPGYYLNDAIGHPIGYFTDTGHFAYNVHVVSPFGCIGDDSIKVWVVDHASYFVPTGFTPNGDGKNDRFKPLAVGYKNINSFKVFNRWGEMVYKGNDFETGWDGTYKGRQAEMGVYFWYLSVTDRFDKQMTLKGDVTLIR